MGNKSTFVSDHLSMVYPQWFKDKHQYINFPNESCISSKFEIKTYGSFSTSTDDDMLAVEMHNDIQKVLEEKKKEGYTPRVTIVWMNENGGVTLVLISHDDIRLYKPSAWDTTDCVNSGGYSWTEDGQLIE